MQNLFERADIFFHFMLLSQSKEEKNEIIKNRKNKTESKISKILMVKFKKNEKCLKH